MKKLLLLILLPILLFANEKLDYSNSVFKEKAFQKLLEEQLITGAEVIEGDGSPFPTYGFTDKELEVEADIYKYVLKTNGYTVPSKKRFLEVLQEKFKCLPTKRISMVGMWCKEEWLTEVFYYNYDATVGSSMVVFRDEHFISLPYALPELIDPDYVSKKFKNLNHKEFKELHPKGDVDETLMWKDYLSTKTRQENIEFLMALNRYVFYDDNTQLAKLLSRGYGFWFHDHPDFIDMFLNSSLNNKKELTTMVEKLIEFDDVEILGKWIKDSHVESLFIEKIRQAKDKNLNPYTQMLLKLEIGSQRLKNVIKKYKLKKTVEINNRQYKSLYAFCTKEGYSVEKIKKLNPWINKEATNIPPNTVIIIDDSAFDIKSKNPQCLHPLDQKELDVFRKKKYKEAETYIVKYREEDNGQTFRFNIIEGLIKRKGEFLKIEGTSCFQYKISESVEAPLSEYESQTWITIEKREGKFVIIEVETAG